jgi:Ni/Co efflux regulator RcnB
MKQLLTVLLLSSICFTAYAQPGARDAAAIAHEQQEKQRKEREEANKKDEARQKAAADAKRDKDAKDAARRLNAELRNPTPPAKHPDPVDTIKNKIPPCTPGTVGDRGGKGINCSGTF